MMARTHGQGAEAQTFGKLALTWYRELLTAWKLVTLVSDYSLQFSKMSGAAGNYGGLDPEVENRALGILGFVPFYGATQIMPRILYAPLAQGLANLAEELHKIGHDIRLKARSPRPLLQEPFKKTQQGSSAMPHKKNPIRTEQLQGMARLARSSADALAQGIATWEERSIEQSCVERVAWPDLFHAVVHSLEVLTGVVSKMPVYLDNMLVELIDLRGCYAAAEAKEALKELGRQYGLSAKEAYAIIQLAAFNVFEPHPKALEIRKQIPQSLEEAAGMFRRMETIPPSPYRAIKLVIASGTLHVSAELECDEQTVLRWNQMLTQIFSNDSACQKWEEVFDLTKLLKHEVVLFREVLGV
jgi:adenylosuccinate lyase